MGFERVAAPIGARLAMFGCGGAAVHAAQSGYPGLFAASLLLAAAMLGRAELRRTPPRHPDDTSAPDPQASERATLRATLDQAPTPMLAIDDGGRVHALNRAARQLFRTDDVVADPPPALQAAGSESRLRIRDRAYRVERSRLIGLSSERSILVLSDVEAQERAAEARATRETLDVLSHEVMNAVAPITSLADSAQATLDSGAGGVASARELLGTIVRRANGLLQFTEAYRSLARLPEPALAPVRAAVIVDDLARLFAARWADRVPLSSILPDDATVTCDLDQVVQAIWALLQNAAESAAAHPQPSVLMSVRVWQGRFIATVSDSGPGVSAEDMEAMFKPFVTSKPQGTGVGLPLARQIARAHGGDVVIRSVKPMTVELAFPSGGRPVAN